MKPCIYTVLLAALCGSLAGCRSGGNTELLESENAQLNERITQLEVAVFDRDATIQQYCRALKRCREQNADDGGDSSNGDGAGSGGMGNGFTPPDVQLGPPRDGSDEPPLQPRPDPGPAPRFDENGNPMRSTGYRVPDDLAVFRVSIDPAQSGTPGDGTQAIVVALEPRNAAGQPLPVAGDLAIAAWDAELLERYSDDDEKCRLAYLAHWTFTAEEAADAFTETTAGPQMRFRLTWPKPQSPGRRLRIFVNYRTADGRQLRADAPLPPNPPGRRAASSTAVTPQNEDEPREPTPTPAEPETSTAEASGSASDNNGGDWTARPHDAGPLRAIAHQPDAPRQAQVRGPAPRGPVPVDMVPRGPAPRVDEPPPAQSRRPRPQWSPERP